MNKYKTSKIPTSDMHGIESGDVEVENCLLRPVQLHRDRTRPDEDSSYGSPQNRFRKSWPSYILAELAV